MSRHKEYKGPSVDPVRDWLGSRPFSSGPEGFVVEDIDGAFVLRHHGQKFGTDSVGQIRLIEWKYADPFRPAELKHAQQTTFGLLDEMLTKAEDPRYCGFLVCTCDLADPADPAARVYVQRIGRNKIQGPYTSDQFAHKIEQPWVPQISLT